MEVKSTDVEITGVKLKKKLRDGDREKLVGVSFVAQIENGLDFARSAFPGLGDHCWRDNGTPNTSGWNLVFSDKFYNYRVRLFNTQTGEIIAECLSGDIAGVSAQIQPRYAIELKGSIVARTKMNTDALHDWLKEMGVGLEIIPAQLDIENAQIAA